MLRTGWDFNKIWIEETAFFFIYIQLVKLIFGEGLQEKIVWWETSHIDIFGKISRSKVKGMKINEQFFNPISIELFYLVVAPGGFSPTSIKFDPDILKLGVVIAYVMFYKKYANLETK